MTINQAPLFKLIVLELLESDTYPGPKVILSKLGSSAQVLSGKQCKWRDEIWEPWMKRNPDHPITRERARRRMQTPEDWMYLENQEAIRGLRDIVADLSP